MVGSVINWPPGSGSVSEDYGSADPDPKYLRTARLSHSLHGTYWNVDEMFLLLLRMKFGDLLFLYVLLPYITYVMQSRRFSQCPAFL